MKCCICGKEIKGYGNNPAPIGGGPCCNQCNTRVVIPYRTFLISMEKGGVAMLIKHDHIELIKQSQPFTLKQVQVAVEGYIELAPKVLDGYLTVVNEEGLLKGLPFNNLAHLLFGCELVGNVLICPEKIFEAPEED